MTAIVLDTNVVLDLLLFADPATPPLREALAAGGRLHGQWIATPVMREELDRVLAYPHIVERLRYYQRSANDLLSAFDAQARLVEVAPKAPYVCKDPDDQKFIDLAFAHQATLLSKDKAVLKLKKRLGAHGVTVSTSL
jgi:putative PIN family toxin of toxin-antitoxin system